MLACFILSILLHVFWQFNFILPTLCTAIRSIMQVSIIVSYAILFHFASYILVGCLHPILSRDNSILSCYFPPSSSNFFQTNKSITNIQHFCCSGVSGRATLPVYHGDYRFTSGTCFMSTSPILGPITVSLVCNSGPNNHRPRNSETSRPKKRGSSRGKSKPYQDKDDSENIDEFDSDVMFSKNGPPISLANNSHPQATSAPGEREKEIVELFKRVQAQLRARGKTKEGKKPEPAKVQGDRGSVDSLLKLLRKHSVDQRRKNSDDKEQNFDLIRRGNDPVSRQSSTTFGSKNESQEELRKPLSASFRRPVSNFRRRSPVPGVKIQPVINADKDANAKNITSNVADVVQEVNETLVETAAIDERDTVSAYESDSDIPPENMALDDFDVNSDDESDTDEPNEEYLEPSLENSDIADSDESHDDSAAASSDLSSLKAAELRELAKSQGIKGYSKMKKLELIEVLGSTA
jgi:hypothetical protein